MCQRWARNRSVRLVPARESVPSRRRKYGILVGAERRARPTNCHYYPNYPTITTQPRRVTRTGNRRETHQNQKKIWEIGAWASRALELTQNSPFKKYPPEKRTVRRGRAPKVARPCFSFSAAARTSRQSHWSNVNSQRVTSRFNTEQAESQVAGGAFNRFTRSHRAARGSSRACGLTLLEVRFAAPNPKSRAPWRYRVCAVWDRLLATADRRFPMWSRSVR